MKRIPCSWCAPILIDLDDVDDNGVDDDGDDNDADAYVDHDDGDTNRCTWMVKKLAKLRRHASRVHFAIILFR